MPELIYHGHACVEIHAAQVKLIIDPFLAGNPQADVAPGDVSCDVILVTHGHGDHLGDTVEIASRTGALVVTTCEMATYLDNKGLNTHAMHIGGAHEFPWGQVKLTNAAHGGMIDAGEPGHYTFPCGFMLTLDDRVIYHPGDTALISDMALYGRLNDIDVAFLPIGDNYTMGPDDAIEAVRMLKPKRVVPMHYNTFELIEQDVELFAQSVEDQTETECLILIPGDCLDLRREH